MSTGAGAIGTGAAIASAPMAIGAGGSATISALSAPPGAGGSSTGAGGSSSSACGLLRPPPRFPAATHATTTAKHSLRMAGCVSPCYSRCGGQHALGRNLRKRPVASTPGRSCPSWRMHAYAEAAQKT
eukprot:scaffold83974_cov45-Phaeocystis_antarctica.AAC.1